MVKKRRRIGVMRCDQAALPGAATIKSELLFNGSMEQAPAAQRQLEYLLGTAHSWFSAHLDRVKRPELKLLSEEAAQRNGVLQNYFQVVRRGTLERITKAEQKRIAQRLSRGASWSDMTKAIRDIAEEEQDTRSTFTHVGDVENYDGAIFVGPCVWQNLPSGLRRKEESALTAILVHELAHAWQLERKLTQYRFFEEPFADLCAATYAARIGISTDPTHDLPARLQPQRQPADTQFDRRIRNHNLKVLAGRTYFSMTGLDMNEVEQVKNLRYARTFIEPRQFRLANEEVKLLYVMMHLIDRGVLDAGGVKPSDMLMEESHA